MIKQFAIFKAKEKKNEKSPDYNISVKVGEKYLNVGGCWLKEGKGGKYFSCKLSDGYQDRKGFSITEDSGLTEEDKEAIKALKANSGETQPKTETNPNNDFF